MSVREQIQNASKERALFYSRLVYSYRMIRTIPDSCRMISIPERITYRYFLPVFLYTGAILNRCSLDFSRLERIQSNRKRNAPVLFRFSGAYRLRLPVGVDAG